MRGLTQFLVLAAIPAELLGQPVFSRAEQRDSAVVHAIEARMRAASGTVIRSGDPRLETAARASDLIRFARGFRWRTPTLVETRGSAAQSPTAARCESSPRSETVRRRGHKVIAIYLDGSQLSGGLEMINRMVPIEDILAVEAYPDVLSAPSLWRTSDACAVIAFWTRRR